MPEVFVNTSPLQYLHQLGHLDLLRRFYGRVAAPQAVVDELEAGRTRGIDLPRRCLANRLTALCVLALVGCLGQVAAVPAAPSAAAARPSDRLWQFLGDHPKSGVFGYPGEVALRKFLFREFRRLGLEEVHGLPFQTATPLEREAQVTLGGRRVPLHCFWPNMARTCTVPEGGLQAKLLYGGDGRYAAFDGKTVAGRIVVLDLDCGDRWLNAFELGAEAVLFLPDASARRQEYEAKLLSLPLNAPRFLVPEDEADTLRRQALAEADAVLEAWQEWRQVTGYDVLGKIPGTDPELSKEHLILAAHYDRVSAVPSLAPGASGLVGLAALLDVAEKLAQAPPKRTVVFLATSAHYLGMAGMGAFVRAYDLASRDVVLPVDLDAEGNRSERLKKLMARYFSGYLDEKKLPLSFLFSLDLGAGNSQVGVFHFGGYEENRDLYRERRYTEVGGALSRLAEPLAEQTATGMARFADGINPKKGRSPESYFSELPAFESEVASLLFPGVAWATCSDDRDYVDTPGDTLARLNRTNVEAQLRLLSAVLPQVASDPAFPVRTAEDKRLKDPLFGQSVWWDKGETFFPNTPVPNPLVVAAIERGRLSGFMRSYPKPVFGVHLETVVVGSAEGKWSLENFLWPSRARVVSYGVDPAVLAAGDLAHPTELADRLLKPNDAHLRWLVSRLSAETRERLEKYDQTRDGTVAVDRHLMNELNALIRGKSLREVSVFAEEPLPVQLAARLGPGAEDRDVRRANRWLLARALPDFLTPPPRSGDLCFAPDRGDEGDRKAPFIRLDVTAKAGRPVTQILFRCAAVDFVNLFDPRQLTALRNLSVLDGQQATTPMEFGFMLPMATRYDSSYVEPCAVVFAAPESNLSLLMGGGLIGHRLVLIHAREDPPFGRGIPATTRRVPLVIRQVADDLYQLDKYRLGILKKHGVESEYLEDLHNETHDLLVQSAADIEAKRWSSALPKANRAWALESTVYPAALQTANDVVRGVLFYLMLALPFAYFIERLLFSFADIRKQIVATAGVFAVVMTILAWAHPAFSITFTPFIIFLGFVVLTLALVVSAIIVNKFQEELKQFRGGMRGVQEADVNRVGALAAAISLGIANMRRRPIRTWLTCITIVLLTFTVLSFTSIHGFIKYNKFKLPWRATTEGLMLRNLSWGALEEGEHRGFVESLSADFDLAPRYWHVSSRPEEPMATEVTVKVADATGTRRRPLTFDTIVGVGEHEPKCTEVLNTLTAGRWLRAGEDACLLPRSAAEAAGVDASNLEAATVEYFGTKLRVCGLFDADKMDQVKGLGDEPLAPVNFLMYRPTFRAEDQELHPDALAMEEYIHWQSSTMLLVSAEVVAAKGGTLRQLMAAPKHQVDLEAKLSELLRKWSLILYVGHNGEAKLYSSLSSSSVSGLKDLFIPVLIAAIIVLNTMLGSVYERVREIGIYNSVGLSPVHIASLFLAEAAVYATIGAILGYLLGQVAAKLLTVTGLLKGLTLNYSSGAAVMSICFVIVVVILSSLYPARQATRMAVPDLETSWQLGDPEGDDWAFRLPFQVSAEQALDMAGFMYEFFSLHREQAVGNFFAQGVTLADPGGEASPELTFTAWLAPYDFGVSHEVRMWTEEVAPGTRGWRLDLHRLSGDVNSWRRASQMFLKRIRKQLLLWRAVKPEDRHAYREIAEARLTRKDRL